MDLAEVLSRYSSGNTNNVYVCTFDTPVGKVTAAADDEFLYMVSFEGSKTFVKNLETIAEETKCNFVQKENHLLEEFEDELLQYFDGKLKKFTVPIKTFGTSFQKEVWNKLQEIPYGATLTYGDISKSIGRGTSHSRAVGAVCGANAHLLVIPCHRVVATNSKGGFGSGVDRKEWLLNHEKKHST